ncbi:integrase core domain-containing protein [Nocardia takedensis]|uniref:integrase core domain-containing protein n=1 Tax=Nocardia takedensis TaxID=259390 RepID=UPI000312FC4F|nr:integrase core domain-containing protein [Nocardia takedensis]
MVQRSMMPNNTSTKFIHDAEVKAKYSGIQGLSARVRRNSTFLWVSQRSEVFQRFHKTQREEFLNHVAPVESIAAAQDVVDGWFAGYDHQRPHQALDWGTPASLFRPNGPARLYVANQSEEGTSAQGSSSASPQVIDVIEPVPIPSGEGAVESDVRVPVGGAPTAGPW